MKLILESDEEAEALKTNCVSIDELKATIDKNDLDRDIEILLLDDGK